ncbi:SwmB domain-containing protein, partial [bacterium]|nr:SwmB domain-containing protein [bacterium]
MLFLGFGSSEYVAIYAFESGSWQQRGSNISGEAASDLFGGAVSLSSDGNTVAIGATNNDGGGSDSGHVRIYNWDGTTWSQLGPDIDGSAAHDRSGFSISLSNDGSIVAIGANENTGLDGSYHGYTRIFKWNSGASSWDQLGADIDGAANYDYAGSSVALSEDGETIAIGTPGSDLPGSGAGHTSIYNWNGSSWSQIGTNITGEDEGDASGANETVAISNDGTIVAIGAKKNDETGNNAGHTRVFKWDGSSWNQLGSDIDGEAAEDQSGSVSLSANGEILAIGAWKNDGGGSNSGHVRIYRLVSGSWIKTGDDIDGLGTDDWAGFSVSLSEDGNTLAVGTGVLESYVQVFDLGLDSTAPTFSSAATSTDGTKVVLTYNEALSSTTAATSDFAVTTDGSANAVTAVAISGSTVELTLTNTVKNDQAVTVAYTDPTSGNDANAVQDSSGNDAASLTSTSVTNNSTVAGTAPTFSSAATNSAGTKVVLTYNEALDSTTAATSDFAVTTDGSANTVTAVAISGSTVELTITRTIASWQTVTVAYTDPTSGNDTNAVQDSAGNDAASLTSTSVTNNSTQKFAQIGSNITGDTSSDFFGRAVSLSNDGTIIAVGASTGAGDNANAGHAQIYEWNSGTSAWDQRGSNINGESSGDKFGESIALSGDGSIVVIGASNHDTPSRDIGYVQAYEWDGSNWNQLGADIQGEAQDDFSGFCLSLSDDGTIVAIGAGSNDGGGDMSGHTRIYKYDGTDWNQLGADLDGAAAGDRTGEAVAISGDGQTIAIGAYKSDRNGTDSGHTSIYRLNGSVWGALGSDIIGEAAGDESGGRAIALSEDGTIVAIGAIKNTGGGTGANTGHTRIFQWNSGTSSWDQLGDDIDGETAGDLSGRSVALSSNGTVLAISAIENDGGGSNSGHVRIYRLVSGSWVKTGEDIDGLSANDETGLSISLSEDGDTLAVGSGSSADYVRIFDLRL